MQEVFYFHHGLRFCSQKIRDYIKQGDILDIGAFTGDSAIALLGYTNKNIYSYELSPKHIKIINFNLIKFDNYSQNHYGRQLSKHVVVINKGISDKKDVVYIKDVSNAGGSISTKGKIPINIDTIDDEVKRLNIFPRFIKADVEGVGLNVPKGSIKTINKYRPVISIAIYHSYDEFFGIFEFMKQFSNYLCEFHSENNKLMSMCEISAFFYPAELIYHQFPQYS